MILNLSGVKKMVYGVNLDIRFMPGLHFKELKGSTRTHPSSSGQVGHPTLNRRLFATHQ